MRRTVTFLISWAAFTGQLLASSYMSAEPEELMEKAEHTISGEVVDIKGEYEHSGIQFLYIEIRVDKVHITKNTNRIIPGDLVVIRQMGNGTESEGNFTSAEGLPQFTINTQVYVYISAYPQDPDLYYVVAGPQGKYEDPGDGELIRDTTGSFFVRRGQNGAITVNPGRVESISSSDMEAKAEIIRRKRNNEI